MSTICEIGDWYIECDDGCICIGNANDENNGDCWCTEDLKRDTKFKCDLETVVDISANNISLSSLCVLLSRFTPHNLAVPADRKGEERISLIKKGITFSVFLADLGLVMIKD